MKKINTKFISKMLFIIDCFAEKNIFKFSEDITTRLINLPGMYDLYVNRTNEEKDETIIFYLKRLENYKSKNGSNETSLISSKLEEKLKKLENKIASQEQQYEELRKKSDKKEELISDKNNKIKELKDTINEQIKCIQDLNQKNENVININEHLAKECNNLLTSIDELKKVLASKDEKLEIQRKIEIQKQKENIISETILNKIYNKGYSFEDLHKELQDVGYTLSEDELFNILIKINERFCIINEKYYPPRYEVSQPEIKTNQSLTINTCNKACYDIFLTSDFHIGSMKYELVKFNVMYDYCTKNNIGLILNLGDFINGIENIKYKYGKREYYNKIAEQIIERFPKSPNIHQIILGGNHDRKSLRLGLDILKIISSARIDLTNIGYDEAKIYIDSDIHPLVLHHFNKKIKNKELLVQRINDYYSRNGDGFDDTYLNLVGHLHKSGYNYSDNYCIVPSLTWDRYQNGAWHLKIYLNEDGTIKYIILIPLILLNNKLLPTSEIVHERKLIKQLNK